MRNVWTIIKKEFSRFFKDKRMIITVLLPGLLIYLVYSLMGTVMENIIDKPAEDIKYTAYVENMPQNTVLSAYLNSLLEYDTEATAETASQKVESGNLDLYIIFPANFDEVLENKADETPDVKIYYNSSVDNSYSGFMVINSVLEGFKDPAFSVNIGGNTDLAGEKETAGKMLSMFMPMLMFALLVSGCVAVAPEAIAGEKERGTMATMLITPIKRWQLALGKIISLSCFAMLSGISSFIGVIASLPKLMTGMAGSELAISYAVLVIISAFSVLSAFAKSVKEAGTLITPLMILIIVLGVVSMVVPSASVGLFAIPLLGCELAMSAIFTFSITPLGFVLAVLSNIALAAVLIVALSFMFRSEKIMFNK